jgi:hypothetical protein
LNSNHKEQIFLMKRCPKCNKSFPDDNQKFCTIDGGLLVAAERPFDPNATMQGVTNRGLPPTEVLEGKTPQGETRDLNATIASVGSAPTVMFPKQTGPTPPPFSRVPSAPLPQSPESQARQTGALHPPVVEAAKKKSKLPLILGILALLLVLGIGAVVAAFFLFIKPRLNEMEGNRPTVTNQNQNQNVNNNQANNNASTSNEEPKTDAEFVPPPNTVKFTNSQANLDGKLAEHYLDFSFYYPKTWTVDSKAGVPGASNFAKVERMLPPDFTQENFAVGWYTSKGNFAADESTFPQLVERLGSNLAKGFPEYRKVSEGPTKVNSLDGYEFRFESVSKGTEKGDIQLWGRVVFLPTGVSGEQTGATLIMLATSLAPELSGVDDVGSKGEMPVILDSFRFGKSR